MEFIQRRLDRQRRLLFLLGEDVLARFQTSEIRSEDGVLELDENGALLHELAFGHRAAL